MPQTELISTRRHPLAMYVASTVFVLLAITCRFLYDEISWAHADLVHWKAISAGQAEAKRLRKPVLYYFTADWCAPCKTLKAECFSNAKIADLINERYVPIRVVDRKLEEGENTKAVEEIQDKYDCNSFPQMVIVPWENIDSPSEDVYAVSTSAQETLRGTYSYWLPEHNGYKSREDIEEYFRIMQIWGKMRPARGNIAWKPIHNLKKKSGTRPELIVVLGDKERDSNRVRTNFFCNEECSKYLNENFDNYLIEWSRAGIASTQEQADELKTAYNLKKLPAFIVLDKDRKEPAVLTGYSNDVSVLDFLERATGGKAKAPELRSGQR